MSAGKAKGRDRDYQVFVKDVLYRVNSELVPYQGDGIDITFNVSEVNATITFDILLQDAKGNLIAGECKRWKFSIKQNEIFAFQAKLDELRRITKREVSGTFFVKHAFQLGAIKFANRYDIKVITCNEQQPLGEFSLTNLHYDVVRDKQIRQGEAHLSGNVGMSGTVTMRVHNSATGEWIDIESGN